MHLTPLQIILAILAFAGAFYVINRYIEPVTFRHILNAVVVLLALFVLLGWLGLMPMLNTPIR